MTTMAEQPQDLLCEQFVRQVSYSSANDTTIEVIVENTETLSLTTRSTSVQPDGTEALPSQSSSTMVIGSLFEDETDVEGAGTQTNQPAATPTPTPTPTPAPTTPERVAAMFRMVLAAITERLSPVIPAIATATAAPAPASASAPAPAPATALAAPVQWLATPAYLTAPPQARAVFPEPEPAPAPVVVEAPPAAPVLPPCFLCKEPAEPVGIETGGEHFVKADVCSHNACMTCMNQWIEAQLSEQHFVRCPVEGCRFKLYNDDISRFSEEFGAKHMELSKQEYEAHTAEVMAIEDSTFKEWISEHTTVCPKCSILIERSEGCDRMLCVCSYGFCFQCKSSDCYGDCAAADLFD